MSERIDQFCENLRLRLTSIDNIMQALRSKIDNKAQSAEHDVRTQLGAVKKSIEQDRAKVTAAQNNVKKWIEQREATTDERIAELKAKHEIAKLQSRADYAEVYASAAAVIALAAVDEAEEASLEAWLARKDADNARAKAA